MRSKTILLAGAVVLTLATGARAHDSNLTDGNWVEGSNQSCIEVCQASGLTAFMAGHYGSDHATPENHYTICRIRPAATATSGTAYSSRPGFQHQKGSPWTCRVWGLNYTRSQLYQCLCL
jgi:hypothetical protein